TLATSTLPDVPTTTTVTGPDTTTKKPYYKYYGKYYGRYHHHRRHHCARWCKWQPPSTRKWNPLCRDCDKGNDEGQTRLVQEEEEGAP
ncbi:unnamed protein product, partial [Symbiodinium sp. KB8]